MRFRDNWNDRKGESELLVTMSRKIAAARWFSRVCCFHEFKVGEYWADCVGETHPWVIVYGPQGKVVSLPMTSVSVLSYEPSVMKLQ